MRKILIGLVLALAAGWLSSCAGIGPYPDLKPFDQVAPNLPPPAPGLARFYFYRLLSYYDIRAGTTAYLNGQPVGFSRIGTVFYRDVTPGSYFVSVASPGAFPNQFKTVQVAAGQVVYAHIESLLSWSDGSGIDSHGATFTVVLEDPALATEEMHGLYYIPPS